MSMKTIGKNIAAARRNAGLSQPELADKLGWGQSRISNYERGQREPKLDDLKAISNVLKIDMYDLIPGNTNIEPKNVAILEKKHYVIGQFDTWDSHTPLSADEVEIPFYKEIELAAGNGSIVQREDIGFKLRFAKSTLRRYNIQAEMAACAVVSGNSMSPVLPDQSTVGIDTGNTKIKDGDMYAIDHGGMLRVKVLYRLPGGGIRMRSFNQSEYPDEDYSPKQCSDLVILGRVFWYSVLL